MITAYLEDPDWRRDLHAKLEAILDERAELEARAEIRQTHENSAFQHGSYAYLSKGPVRLEAHALLRAAASLAAEAVGVPLRSAALQMPANDGPGQRAALRDWLNALEPLTYLPLPTPLTNEGDESLAEHIVWLGLRALDVGEVWDLFEPGKRGNRPANLYSLSIARLSALEWKRRLLSLGHSEGDANRQITAAYGEQWDTIRKWERSCAATLGSVFVAASLARADHDESHNVGRPRGLFGRLMDPPAERLQAAGDKYRTQKRRAAELSPAKQRAARRSEKQSAQISG